MFEKLKNEKINAYLNISCWLKRQESNGVAAACPLTLPQATARNKYGDKKSSSETETFNYKSLYPVLNNITKPPVDTDDQIDEIDEDLMWAFANTKDSKNFKPIRKVVSEVIFP